MMRQRIHCLVMTLAVGCLLYTSAYAAGVNDPLDRPAMMIRGAARAVLLDITTAGKRLVAVGERGIVVLSDDAGKTWRQVHVPTSVSLTSVAFPTAEKGWAAGHSGVVLHTRDGGRNWVRQLDGVAAANLALEAAQEKMKEMKADSTRQEKEALERHLQDAQLLVDDGPDKPFLDILFENDRQGFIVGAYGLIFKTVDGGETWHSWIDRVDNPDGMNLYGIQAVGSTYYIVGEQGLVLKSTDGGDSFVRVNTPYQGTYFVSAAAASGEIVLAGLRGNAYWSDDQGATLTRTEVPAPISFSAAKTLDNGTLLFANQAGQLLASRDGGRTIQILDTPRLPPIASMASFGDNVILTVGLGGVIPVPLPGVNAAVNTGDNE